MMVFVIYETNRLLYVLNFIFTQFATVPFTITKTEKEFINYSGPKINYADKPLCNNEIHIVPSHFLEEIRFRQFTADIEIIDEMPVLFGAKNSSENTWRFDIFSAVFYMLSRYEEYNSKAKDQYGRFPAKESVAYQHHFLHLPIVDIWLTELMNEIKKTYNISFNRQTTISFTYDIDVAYAYKGREIVRQAGSALKDVFRIDPYNLAQRTAVLAGYLEDTFDTYDYIRQESINPTIFFLLSERKTKYDRNINPKKTVIKNLIKEVEKWCPVGLHPSFYTSEKEEKLASEKKILEAITGYPITKSRQHYLKFKMPQTYQNLLRNGITEDYSMAFAETPGFRAGTCTPFYFFDMEKNEATELKLFPSCIMESTFRDNITIPVQEALPIFIQYFEAVNKVNGHFISIWHNDTLAANNRQNFRWLHQQILQYIRSRMKQ